MATIKSIDPSRIKIVYGDEGGLEKDGVIELRKDVPDISLGDSKYTQIRIAVGDDQFLRGMALYSDGPFEGGIDIIHYTRKLRGDEIFRKLQTDSELIFGVPTRKATDDSLINIVKDDRDWDAWTQYTNKLFMKGESTLGNN